MNNLMDNMSDIESDENSSVSDSESSEDDLLEELLYERPRPKNENFFEETIPQYQEEFFEHFRGTRHVAESLATKFESSEYYKRHSGQDGKLSALQQV